jgi:Tfp pilus assembly protein PilE
LKLRLYRNNKGSSLVLVIIVLAFVGILATVALWASLTNFQMKVTDRNVTDNFYSAEGVLDQIRVGLQNDVSGSMSDAYKTVMQEYASLSEEDREDRFSAEYINELSQKLSYTKKSVTYGGATIAADRLCSIEKLTKYVYVDSSKGSFVLKNGGTVTEGDEKEYCFLNIVSSGIVIDNLVVEYTDHKGNLSIIQTDILLQVPNLNMVSSSSAPQVFDYSIIGNAGVEFKGPGTTLIGSMYAGSQYALSGKNTSYTGSEDEYYKSLVIANTSNVDFSKAATVIADGDLWAISTTGSADTLTTGKTTQLWARNINLKNATALLAGVTNVGDDMVLSGEGSKLTIKGNYVGYGDNRTGDEGSSAIIINGKNSVLDMSEAKLVALSGYAYINTGAITTTNSQTSTNTTDVTKNNNIQLGESILVKGDQIAYLVPSECVATVGWTDSSAGTSAFKKNPLTVAEYNKIKDDTATYKLVDENVITKTGKSISEYIESGQKSYQTVLVPSKTGNPDDGLVYLYLNLSAKMASQYFMDYYNAGSEKLTKYNDFYTNGITAAGEDTTISTAGTYAEYEEGKLSYSTGTDNVNVGNLPNTYEALTTKLVSDHALLSSTDAKTVFENVINKDVLESFLSGGEYTASQSGTGGEELHIVLTDNKNGDPYVFNDGNQKHVYIIVATGDVFIDANFTGTVIADGKVTVGTDGTVEVDSNITVQKTTTENIKKMLLMSCAKGSTTKTMYQFFKDGNEYIASGFIGSSSTGSSDTGEVNLSDLITYQDWKKK